MVYVTENAAKKIISFRVEEGLKNRFAGKVQGQGLELQDVLRDFVVRYLADAPASGAAETRKEAPSGTKPLVVELVPGVSRAELRECVQKLNYILQRQQPRAITALLTNVDAFLELTILSERTPPPGDRTAETVQATDIPEDLKRALAALERSRRKPKAG